MAGVEIRPHFAGGQPLADAQALASDLEKLSTLSAEQIRQFADIIVAFLVSPSSNDLMGALSAFARDHSANAKALKGSLRAVLVVFKGAMRYTLTPLQLQSDLESLGLAETSAAVVGEAWRSNYVSLSRSVIGQTFMVNRLVDLEWKFGVTGASDELDQVGATFLQLKLHIDTGKETGAARESVAMELTLPQFYSFLSSMHQAKSQLDYLST